MKTVFIFTIEFFNASNNVEYKTIKGVYEHRTTAEEAALKSLNTQKAMWPGSEVVYINSNKTALKSGCGFSKVYTVKEMLLNQTI